MHIDLSKSGSQSYAKEDYQMRNIPIRNRDTAQRTEHTAESNELMQSWLASTPAEVTHLLNDKSYQIKKIHGPSDLSALKSKISTLTSNEPTVNTVDLTSEMNQRQLLNMLNTK